MENLAQELVALPPGDLKSLECDAFLLEEIRTAQPLSGGARKRQVKYIAKQLRQDEIEPLLDFLASRKGSQLKETNIFHELERFRDDLVDEALAEMEEAWRLNSQPDSEWPSPTLDEICRRFPQSDAMAMRQAALSFARTHKKAHSRALFRLIKTAADQAEWRESQ